MSNNHTPEPWDINGSEIVSRNPHFTICCVNQESWNREISDEQFEANKKLIASAPELLEALIEFHQMYEKLTENMTSRIGWDVNAKAIRAIKKATE